MAAPLQQASVRRKLYYLVLIAVLLTVTIFWRGVIDVPLSGVGDWFGRQTIQARAQDLELREIERGEAELTGSAIRLLLTGSRGLVTCGLWISAIEHQKRHEWNELEQIVNSLTALQPHFLTPWLFQSWNLTYNVSVEADRLGDMYFYIARGIQLLAEGERLNRNNPDMRYNLAFYYQNKFGVSDKVNTLRSLFDLSCIKPADRTAADYGEIRDGRVVKVYPEEFRRFCEKNPFLVRRLRESTIRLQRPEDIVQFLHDNAKVPSRYKNARELAAATEQFPVLPPPYPGGEAELNPDKEADFKFDGFLAARAWYGYSLLPLPDPDREPSKAPDPRDIPRDRRLPRRPMLIIFRQGKPRAETYYADRLQDEGWYDGSGWQVDEGHSGRDRWFPNETVVLGTGEPWSRMAWDDAYTTWLEHGRANGLYLEPERLEAYRNEAILLERLGIATLHQNTPEMTEEQREDPTLRRAFEAHRRLMYYRQNIHVTNFPYFLHSAEAEREPTTIEARKRFHEAEQLRGRGEREEAIKAYEDAFALWLEVLAKHPAYLRDERTETLQDESFEWEVEYFGLVRDRYGAGVVMAPLDTEAPVAKLAERRRALPDLRRFLENVQYQSLRGLCLAAEGPLAGLTSVAVLKHSDPTLDQVIPVPLASPLAGNAPDGQPWVTEAVRQAGRVRLGLEVPGEAAPARPGGGSEPPGE